MFCIKTYCIGIPQLDLLLGTWAEGTVSELIKTEIEALIVLLRESPEDLYCYFSGEKSLPPRLRTDVSDMIFEWRDIGKFPMNKNQQSSNN